MISKKRLSLQIKFYALIMKTSSDLSKFLIIVYIILLTLCLINEIACLGYYTYVFDKETRAMLPEKVIFPEYDKTGEVTNADEVTAWDYTGFVPENLYKVHNYFCRVADGKASVHAMVLLGLFLPMLICYKRTYTKPYLAITFLVLIIVITWFVMPRVCGG